MGPFQLAVHKWAELQKRQVDEVVREVVYQLSERIIERSPVDTGFFRANWTVSSEVAGPGGVVARGAAPGAEVDPTGELTLSAIRRGLEAGKFQRQWVISNNARYAWKLEYGHSKQAPQGMVGVTVLEFTTVVFLAVGTVQARGPGS